MKPYPRYKPTGLAWLPSVPEHWETKRLKNLFEERKEVNRDGENTCVLSLLKDVGVIPYEEKGNIGNKSKEDITQYKIARKGDLVLNSMNVIIGSVGVSGYDGCVSPVYYALRPRRGTNAKYYEHLMRLPNVQKVIRGRANGILEIRLRISAGALLDLSFPLPPPSEQDRIVRYLDEKTAAIDELVRAKEREIDLLRERKQALVSAAVTGGLDPATERKDSGVPWIGKIPKGWNVLKLRQILSPVSEKNRPDLPLLSVVREKGVIIRDKDDMEENRNFIPDDLSGYKVVRKGQFAMNKMKAWQGSYGVSPYDGIVSPAYFVFNIRFDNPEYFHLAIRSKVYVDFFAQASDGIRIGQWDLNLTKMKEIPFLVPPASGQKEIVERMPVLFAETDRKIALAEKSIALLQELRTRLVSDAVTGAVAVG